MKKIYFFLLFATLSFSASYAQLMQASIGTGSTTTRYKIYIKGATTQTPSNISTLQFNLGVSDATSPKPTMTVFSSSLTGVSVAAWTVTEATEGGYYNYSLTNSLSTIASNFTANTEVEALEVEFTGGPATMSVGLVTLPDGGSGLSLFNCTGSYTSDGISNLYYSRPGVVVDNQFSYDPTGGSSGTTTSTVFISSGGSLITDMFRTVQSGNWGTNATWESSTDGITWIPATLTPTDASAKIQIRNGHTITVAAPLSTDETFVAPQGMLIVNDALTVLNQGLTFESDVTFTGILGSSTGTIIGDVNVDRFVPARRAWRLMNASVNATETINASWQEGGNNAAGQGTHITGGTVANGFDQSPTNNPSIKFYNAGTNSLNGLSSTSVGVSSQPGYFLFVRGDRTINLSQGAASVPTNTTLTVTGTPRKGLQSNPVNAAGFTLIGNPFISPIDFALVSKTNVPDRFFVWDPKRATVGAYILFENNGGNYEPIPSGGGGSYPGNNSLIQTGQSFFVETAGAGASLGINEDDKSVTQQNVFRTNNGTDERLAVNLHFVNADNTTTMADGTVSRYNNSYSTAVTIEDAGKLDNIDENIATIRNNRLLTVERRPLISAGDTMFMKMYNMKQRNYRFEITPDNFSATAGLNAYLEDSYLNISTPVSLTIPTTVQFNVTAVAGSADAYRFRIVFKPSGTLPVNFTKVKGYRKDAGVQVDWNVAAERNVKQYDIEKSADGRTFEKAGVQTAKGNNNGAQSYGWYDANPYNGNNYYRIKSTDFNGSVLYSEVVNVKLDGKGGIAIYPNPVTNGRFVAAFKDLEKGTYTLKLINKAGQTMFTKVIQHGGTNSSYPVTVTKGMARGAYDLQVTNGESVLVQKIIVE